jgi:hypothetical protein
MFVRILPSDIVDRITRWDDLKRWERREIGQTLRRMGLSYREISAVIPVTKGTLSGWCRDIPLRDERRGELLGKRGGRAQVGALLRARAEERAAMIRSAARDEARTLLADPFWVAGVVAYWAEGAKRQNEMLFSNSDVRMVTLFIRWAETYLGASRCAMTIKLHLHTGQDEDERRHFWSAATGIPQMNFRKTYLKPEGTGHRKNMLYNGTASVRIPRSSSLLHRVQGWIDAVAEHAIELRYTAAGC